MGLVKIKQIWNNLENVELVDCCQVQMRLNMRQNVLRYSSLSCYLLEFG